ncbi:hypothetical protein B566_EDAN010023 [Ephemera danica]|nr:hypothetical protein B566_EDAN010023 [Ephemera danica]
MIKLEPGESQPDDLNAQSRGLR